MSKTLNAIKKTVIYLLGLLIIALGIGLSNKSNLGISPVSSIPKVLSTKFDSFSLGNMVIIVYCLLVVAQLIVLRKKFKLKNILGVPVALIFGIMVDFVGIKEYKLTIAGIIDLGIEKKFSGLLMFLPTPTNYVFKLIYLLISIVVIGIGVYIYLYPNLVPMPAEGLAGAISEVSEKPFGNCKTYVDVGLILIALILQVILLGGLNSFIGDKVVVREGTILSAICVGQVVKFLKRKFSKN